MATIIQKVVFNNTTTNQLYYLYMDPKIASEIAGNPVQISETPGSKMEAFGGYITGKILQVVKNKLVVQSGRGSDWTNTDSDSAFLLSFEQKGSDCVLNVVHANVPDDKSENLDKGWYDHYWNPWKQYLEGKPITRPAMA
jgi:activator of HSP90 ATPase